MKYVLGLLAVAVLGFGVSYLKVRPFKEKSSNEPEKTIKAKIISKEVKRGTNETGRSVMGYSYAINFLTEDGEELELFAYETEFGGLKEGSEGLLTYKGRYFVDFK